MTMNPELFATAMASSGISPNAVTNPLVPPGISQADPLAALFTGSMGGPNASTVAAVTPPNAVAGTPNPANQQANLLSALTGVKGPQPSKPVFQGGVSGSQAAPGMSVKGGSSASADALMSMLMGGGGPGSGGALRVPDLAMLLKGV